MISRYSRRLNADPLEHVGGLARVGPELLGVDAAKASASDHQQTTALCSGLDSLLLLDNGLVPTPSHQPSRANLLTKDNWPARAFGGLGRQILQDRPLFPQLAARSIRG